MKFRLTPNPKKWKGRIKNNTSKMLWIVETDSGRAKAHKLAPNKKTPENVDADGVKTIDGTPISGHSSWWKIGNTEWTEVKEQGNSLIIESFPSFSKTAVGENEFGIVNYEHNPHWGTFF